MTSTNDEFLQYLNFAREYPSYYLPIIEKQINSFVNDRQMPLAQGVLYETNEGKNAWIQARNFIKQQKSLPPFIKHAGLCKSASDHKNDLCQNGIFGHRGSDGSSFSERILRRCKKGPGAMAQIIGADFDIRDRNPAQMTILSLIIDDGVKDRGHRKTIFSPTYRYVGWSTGKQDQKNITVFNLTQNNLQTFYGGNGNSNQNSFCGVTGTGTGVKPNTNVNVNITNTNTRTSMTTKPQNGSGILWQKGVQAVRDITNHTYPTPSQNKHQDNKLNGSNGFSLSYGGSSGSGTGSDFSKFGLRKGKKVTQKRQNTKTFYEEGAKIIETTTRLIYNDGSVEENTDRRTIYIDE